MKTQIEKKLTHFHVERSTFIEDYTALKVSKYGVISGPYFLVFGLNTEIYEVNLRIQSEYRKKRTRSNSVFGHLSCSVRSKEIERTNPLTVIFLYRFK